MVVDRYLGKTIKNDLINAYGVTVIPAGSVLNEEHLDLIRKQKISEMDIVLAYNPDDSSGTKDMAEATVGLLKGLLSSLDDSGAIPVEEIQNEVLPALREMSEQPDIFELFQSIRGSDDYTYQHNIGVGIISSLIGRWMGLEEEDLAQLTLAATLHDIGKLKISTELLNKPGKLTPEEFEIVKLHTVHGYDMLKDIYGPDSRISLTALQHHERGDGNGYPHGIKTEEIHLFSKIVAVADIFHAMSSKRPYHDAIPFHIIVDQMRRGSFGLLDPQIVSVFLNNIVKRTIGREVVLTDGRVGEIVYLNPHNIETPLIRVQDEYIDLSRSTDLHIKEITI